MTPELLKRLIEDLRDSNSPLSKTQATIFRDDLAKLRESAEAWDAAERERDAALAEARRLADLRREAAEQAQAERDRWVDAIRRVDQLTELCRGLVDYRRRAGAINFQLEKADTWIRKMENALEI